jgi:hypothetical protein
MMRGDLYRCIAVPEVVEIIFCDDEIVRYRMYGGDERVASRIWFEVWYRNMWAKKG